MDPAAVALMAQCEEAACLMWGGGIDAVGCYSTLQLSVDLNKNGCVLFEQVQEMGRSGSYLRGLDQLGRRLRGGGEAGECGK